MIRTMLAAAMHRLVSDIPRSVSFIRIVLGVRGVRVHNLSSVTVCGSRVIMRPRPSTHGAPTPSQ